MDKYVCRECDAHMQEDAIMWADNPFDPGDKITGCTNCKAVESLRRACDEKGCWRPVSCGTPTPYDGYRNTCGSHVPIKPTTDTK